MPVGDGTELTRASPVSGVLSVGLSPQLTAKIKIVIKISLIFFSFEYPPFENIEYAMNRTYFHWGIHAWIIYCIASICMACSTHNSKKPLTYRDTILDLFPVKSRGFYPYV